MGVVDFSILFWKRPRYRGGWISCVWKIPFIFNFFSDGIIGEKSSFLRGSCKVCQEIIDPNPLGKVRKTTRRRAHRHARRVCLPANWNRYSITTDSRASLDTFETQSNFISTVSICVPLAPRVHRTLLPSLIALFVNDLLLLIYSIYINCSLFSISPHSSRIIIQW